MKSVLNDEDSKFTSEEVNENIGAYLDKLNESKFKANKDASEAFLAENAKKDNVITLPSGLQEKRIQT